MYMDVLLVYRSVYHVFLVIAEDQRANHIPRNWIFR